MSRFITLILLVGTTNISIAQTIGEDVQETIPAFGYCIMPDNRTFLALEADYDGMYITERELIDLFETSRFDFSKDLVNWTYYSYWALNERTLKQPEDHSFYQMIVDPTGTYLAVAKVRRDGWATRIQLFNKGSQIKISEFDVADTNENIDFLNQVLFDKEGKNLILGTNDQGIYSYAIEKNELSDLYPAYKYLCYDYYYKSGLPMLKE